MGNDTTTDDEEPTDIPTALEDAKKCIQDRIDKAMAIRNQVNGPNEAKMTKIIDALGARRDEIFLSDFLKALHSDEMKAALAAIVAATKDMKKVAKIMTDVTTFISKAASFLDAGAKVVDVVTGLQAANA